MNKGKLEVADELIADDFLEHNAPPDLPSGLAGFKQLLAMIVATFPDISVTVEDTIAEGDKVAARLTVSGTHRGPFWGLPPTGRQVTWTGIDFVSFAGGKLAERWPERDFLGLVQQLGAILAPPS